MDETPGTWREGPWVMANGTGPPCLEDPPGATVATTIARQRRVTRRLGMRNTIHRQLRPTLLLPVLKR